MNTTTERPGIARIEYTVEVRGSAIRRAKEVPARVVDRMVAKLEDRGAFNFVIGYAGLR